jgi:hypothetical protein
MRGFASVGCKQLLAFVCLESVYSKGRKPDCKASKGGGKQSESQYIQRIAALFDLD